MCLTMREALFGVEIDEIIMVRPDFKGFRMSFEVVAEGFKSANDSQEFFVVDVVILFSREERLGEVRDGVPSVKKVQLFENGSHSKVTCVCDETERAHSIGEHKDRCGGEGANECVKGSLGVCSPCEGRVFLC